MSATLVAAPAPHQPSSTEDKSAKKAKVKRYSRPSVCLDYLKGQCVGKRAQCKYLHPDLAELHHQLDEMPNGAEVCEVWILTGHCKFGAKCNKLHPPIHREDLLVKPVVAEGAQVDEGKTVAAEGQAKAKDSDEEFEAFAESLLTPFTGLDVDSSDTDQEAQGAVGKESVDKDLCSISVHQEEKKPSGLKSILSKSVFGFDQIFLDILKDLHVIAV